MIKRNLTPKQAKFISNYASPSSNTFGNGYQSALRAGYTNSTARNFTHLRPRWLSESIGRIQAIEPEQITQVLTAVIYNADEPTHIKLKALELMMKYHNMLKQHDEPKKEIIHLALDLSGNTPAQG